jgi:hypothetical protein
MPGIVLNCRLTSLTILRAALPTVFIVMAENQNGKHGSNNQPDEDLWSKHINGLDACPAHKGTKQSKGNESS